MLQLQRFLQIWFDFSMKQQRNLLHFKVICSQLSIINLQDDSLILRASPQDLKKKKKHLSLFIHMFAYFIAQAHHVSVLFSNTPKHDILSC